MGWRDCRPGCAPPEVDEGCVPAAACAVGPACSASGARPPAVHSHRLACPPAPALPTTRLPCPHRPEIGCPARRGRRRRAAQTAACSLWPVSPSSSPRRSWSQTCAPLESPTPCASGQSLAQTTLGARTVRHPPSPTAPQSHWHSSGRCPPDTHPPCPSGRYTGARLPRCACLPSHPHSRPKSACCLEPRRGPRSRHRPLSATQHHPATSLVGISWHCNEPYTLMSSILTISVTTTHCISITYKRIFISMTYNNVNKIK